jgi:hypothetical protein
MGGGIIMAEYDPTDHLWAEYSNQFGLKKGGSGMSLQERLEKGEEVSMRQLINDLLQQLVWIHQREMVHFQVTPNHVFVLEGEEKESRQRYFLVPPEKNRIELFDWEKPHYSPEYKRSIVQNQRYQPTQADDVYAFGDLIYHILSIKYALPRRRLGSAWKKKFNQVAELREKERRCIQAMLTLCWKPRRPSNAIALKNNRIWSDAMEAWGQA